MSQQPITVSLPDALYERLQQIAEENDRSLETVVTESLNLLFLPSQRASINLDEIGNYSDEQLWALVHYRMSWNESARLHELSGKSKLTSLSVEEQIELDQLLDQVDHDLLLRSVALRLLKSRGHKVDHYFAPIP